MPSSRRLIASNTLGSAAASVTFSDIPGTYTDLVIKFSARSAANNSGYGQSMDIRFNSDSANNYSATLLTGLGSSGSDSSRVSNQSKGFLRFAAGDAGQTSNTFSNGEIYIPSYTASANKAYSSFAVNEDNTTTARMSADAELWRNTASITSVYLALNDASNFVSGSSFFLYGISNT